MSVAFRRDSDEEHLEPKFAIPIPPGPNLVTTRGLDQIAARVAELETKLTRLTDEAEMAAARRDLQYWRSRLATAEPMPPPATDKVAFGSRVDILLDGKPMTLTLVGHDEADAGSGLLSFTAPLSRALMGLEVGEVADFRGRADAVCVVGIGFPG